MKGRITASVLLILLLFATAAAAGQESATIFKLGSDVTVEAGTKVKRVIAIGGQVTVDGTVEKDVMAVGASVVLSKKAVVDGDVVSIGGTVVKGRGAEIRGSITEINGSNLGTFVSS
ncbi:MAG: hypothetical protein AB2L22_00005, partial [Syntrophales bacterium]